MFKKLLIGLLAVLLSVGAALANYNIRQLPNGQTEWFDSDAEKDGYQHSVRVGRQYVTLRISSAAETTTHYVVSPISGVLYGAFAVQLSNPVYLVTSWLTFSTMQRTHLDGRQDFNRVTTNYAIALRPSDLQGTIYHSLVTRITGTTYALTQMLGNVRVYEGGLVAIAAGGESSDALGGAPSTFDVIVIFDPKP